MENSQDTVYTLLNNNFHSKTLRLFYLTSLRSLLFPQANQVLQSFLQSQAGVEEAILQADQALTDADKAMAGTGRTELSEGKVALVLPFGRCGNKHFLTPELPLFPWNLSATCGSKRGSLGYMSIQSVLLHHMLKHVV